MIRNVQCIYKRKEGALYDDNFKKRGKKLSEESILWAGLLIVIFLLFQNLGSYLKLHYVQSESQLKEVRAENRADADILEGYIPSTKKKQWELAGKRLRTLLSNRLAIQKSRHRK